MKQKNTKGKWIWLSAVMLFVSVSATTVALAERLNGFLPDDSGAIVLNSSSSASNTQVSQILNSESSEFSESVSIEVSEVSESSLEEDLSVEESKPESSDDPFDDISFENSFPSDNPKDAWITETDAEIFRISYENGEQVVTVNSENGEKVIAPGTENSYTFKFKNVGDTPLEYTVDVKAYFSPDGISIPINARLRRYDGEWIVGNKNEFENITALTSVEDKSTLGAGRYTYYTLDWVWPFESGNDELDTMLGNLTEGEDVSFTIVISTVAYETDDSENEGIKPPQAGDTANTLLWGLIAIVSLIVMLALIFSDKRRREAL